jgi:hypothetical protein
LRLDPRGKVVDTQNRLLSRESSYARREETRRDEGWRTRGDRSHDYSYRREFWSSDPWRGAYAPRWRDEREWRSPQRSDPSYMWGGRRDFFGNGGWRNSW